ncbi:MAG: hypothetical protein Kow00124_11020 [Anaerolineae bacterium]
MASTTVERKLEAEPQAVYDAARGALPALGYIIWKERPIAYLLLSKGQQDGKELEVNVRCSMIRPAILGVTVTGDLPEERLAELGDAVIDQVVAVLGS